MMSERRQAFIEELRLLQDAPGLGLRLKTSRTCPGQGAIQPRWVRLRDSMMKRAFDFLASALLLLFCWPLLLIIIFAIRLQDSGSPIFAQVRIGKNGRPFTCYKLRTMYAGTLNLPTHHVGASSVTALGKQLRRFKIDELPQLVNVLVGEMSLVGPRPCLPSQTDLVEARRRLGVLEVLPGITGLAQVNGVDMSDAIRLAEIDAQYVRTHSLLGDFKLILATLRGQGVGMDRVARQHPDDGSQ
jgi:O-antigen biosynthesis protein WbqP